MAAGPPDLTGWLRKSKGVGVGWDRRWFELRGTELRYLEEKGRLELPCGAKVAPIDDDELGFSIAGAVSSDKGSSVRSLKLRGDSRAERDRWVAAVRHALAAEGAGLADAARAGEAAGCGAAMQQLCSDERAGRKSLEADAAFTLLDMWSLRSQFTQQDAGLGASTKPGTDCGRRVAFSGEDVCLSFGGGSARGSFSAQPCASRLRGEDAAEMLNDAIMKGRWQPGRVLGEGQFGTVRMAILPGGNMLAVKQINAADLFEDGDDGAEARGAYRKEVSVMAQLSHPNLVKYYGTSVTGEFLNIFMEYVPGGSLGELARTLDHPLEEQICAGYTRQILHGLRYLHEQMIIHRDVKGDNILIHPAEGHVKLTDFGSAKKLQQSVVKGNSVAGTPNWMAPEIIIEGEQGGMYSPKVDVWSLGCTVVELLNEGTPPWSRFTSAWACIYHIANSTGEPEGIPECVSERCRHFLGRCFKRDPGERATVTDLLLDTWIYDAPDAAETSEWAQHNALGVTCTLDTIEKAERSATNPGAPAPAEDHADPTADVSC
eukprot:TRINITY_DN16198_c0_g1_i1.p1 TRINITY_DN16198_c0_g1~~TRINITY_DN16198_c0_g1_i1.p1  ORF type:complete len:545 (+),score=140.32 TRINITY_DN16198_c0_g1_i1:93-1727(+)